MYELIVKDIKKTFTLSKKQQKIEKTDSKRKIALAGVSFNAYPGEIYGLLGPNGAGKTTALRCISTLIKSDSGQISLNGSVVGKDNLTIRQDIAFLTSELKLDDYFTPNYLFHYFSNLHGLEPSVIKQRKATLFKRFGIEKFQEVKVSDLSTGMKQKLSIAISLVHDPAVIIFDEPTNGLDILTARSVIEYLLEMKERGKTIIISTHILDVVEKLCDRVGIIIDGELQEEGTLNALKSKTADHSLETLFFTLMQQTVGERDA